jgi:hypothetical protein
MLARCWMLVYKRSREAFVSRSCLAQTPGNKGTQDIGHVPTGRTGDSCVSSMTRRSKTPTSILHIPGTY